MSNLMRIYADLDPSILKKLDSIEGTRSENIEKAVDTYLFLLETYQFLEDSVVKINKLLFSRRNKRRLITKNVRFYSINPDNRE
jgi:hypothetical protein